MEDRNLYEITLDNDSLYLGYILKSNLYVTLFFLVNDSGFLTTKFLVKNNTIKHLIKNTPYTKKINRLVRENSKENILNSYLFKNISLEKYGNEILKSSIIECFFKKYICMIVDIDYNQYTGIIEKYEDENLILNTKTGNKNIILSNIVEINIEDNKILEDYLFGGRDVKVFKRK